MKKYLFGHLFSLNRSVNDLFRSNYGIGQHAIFSLYARYGITPSLHIEKHKLHHKFGDVEGMLRYQGFISPQTIRKKALKSMIMNKLYNSYKGVRRKQGLPFSGQRTHSNAQTTRKLFRSHQLTQSLARAGAVGAKKKGGKK